MIRNVVVGHLRPAEDLAQQAADAALLREGGWSFAITNDWQDADAYRVYDADAEHNRLRREIFAKVCQDIVRVQFQVDG